MHIAKFSTLLYANMHSAENYYYNHDSYCHVNCNASINCNTHLIVHII